MMRFRSLYRTVLAATAGLVLMASGIAGTAMAGVQVVIDVSRQKMTVEVDGEHYAEWRVSTARSGYHTPRGSWRPTRLARMHYSRKYDMAPMPHSVFFKGGYAIHGTNMVRSLGRPASHGCIRLSPRDAAELYSLVQEYGPRNTRISITN